MSIDMRGLIWDPNQGELRRLEAKRRRVIQQRRQKEPPLRWKRQQSGVPGGRWRKHLTEGVISGELIQDAIQDDALNLRQPVLQPFCLEWRWHFEEYRPVLQCVLKLGLLFPSDLVQARFWQHTAALLLGVPQWAFRDAWIVCPAIDGNRLGHVVKVVSCRSAARLPFPLWSELVIFGNTLRPCKFSSLHLLVLALVSDSCLNQLLLQLLPNDNFLILIPSTLYFNLHQRICLLILEGEEGVGGREKEKHLLVACHTPQPATFLVHETALQPTEPPCQGPSAFHLLVGILLTKSLSVIFIISVNLGS